MKKGTKLGWLLLGLSVVLSIWVIVSQSADANQTLEGGFVVTDDGTELVEYTGAGGSITVPDGVTTISSGVFANNNSLTGINLNGVTTLGTGVFQGCKQLQSASLGSVSSVPANTFRECSALTSVSIPGSCTSIGDSAFYGCVSLTSISIPASVTSIPLPSAFAKAENLTSVNIAAGNSNYSSADGCIYNATGSRLVYVPEGKTSVSFAGTCKTIGQNAFSSSSVSEVTIPASITTIEPQSGWSPTIYGYADSAAERFAKDNSLTFIVIGNDNSNDANDDNTDDNGNGDNGDNNNTTPAGGDVNTTDGGGTPTGGNGATGASHELDSTPKTAGPVDARYFLCVAVFLLGIAFIILGRRKKTAYISESKRK